MYTKLQKYFADVIEPFNIPTLRFDFPETFMV